MAWKIKYLESVKKVVKKYDRSTLKRLRTFLERRVATLENPRTLGKALVGSEDIWRYRVGDYRILFQILDSEITILVIEIGHRSKIY